MWQTRYYVRGCWIYPVSAILASLFIDNVKSYHLYVDWQTNDANDSRLRSYKIRYLSLRVLKFHVSSFKILLFFMNNLKGKEENIECQ